MPCATLRAYRVAATHHAPMSMSGEVTVDTTAGGVTIISTTQTTRLITVCNTGSKPCALKLDASSTALTFANGHQLAAGEKLILGAQPGPWGNDLPMTIKAIAGGGGSTTVTAQCIPN